MEGLVFSKVPTSCMVEEVRADQPMEHAKKGNTRLIHHVGDQDGHERCRLAHI